MGALEDILAACDKAAGRAKVIESSVPWVDNGSLGTRQYLRIFGTAFCRIP